MTKSLCRHFSMEIRQAILTDALRVTPQSLYKALYYSIPTLMYFVCQLEKFLCVIAEAQHSTFYNAFT